mgnify:CR=1 FL=1|jgi:arsenate reductase (glutaredoxin)
MIKLYTYKNCGTCKKAIKWLDKKNIRYTVIPIRETPPSKKELLQMLEMYNDELKFLFNTSGQDYRDLNLKEKRLTMPVIKQIELLSSNGNLVKRPFLISNKVKHVGFKVDVWEESFIS